MQSLSQLNKKFLELPRRTKKNLAILFDTIVCILSVWFSYGVCLYQWNDFREKQYYIFLTAIGLSLFFLHYFKLYKTIHRHTGNNGFVQLFCCFIFYLICFSIINIVVNINDLPLSFYILQPLLFFISTGTLRFFIINWLNNHNKERKNFYLNQSNVLIYGAGNAGFRLLAYLIKKNDIKIYGFIDDDSEKYHNFLNGYYVYSSKEIKDIIGQFRITDIYIAIPSAGHHRSNQIINSLYGCGVRVRFFPTSNDIVSSSINSLRYLDFNNLLNRSEIPPDINLLKKNISGKIILVTGAGGSIGSELCRQIIKYLPKTLILIDNNEYSLYKIYEELKDLLVQHVDFCISDNNNSNDEFFSLNQHSVKNSLVTSLVSVCDRNQIVKFIKKHRPDTVFHAAAFKHVPLVEQNPIEGVRNNIFGTLYCAQASIECNVQNFILVSTDKAVRPTNIMGASKRVSELILQSMADHCLNQMHSTKFSMVRFGNVLGSSGSVVPLFCSQIARGGPITLTHPDVTRYFMTIPEAAQLVIQAGAMASGGDVFVLDMGNPIRIYDLAVKLVYLSGHLVKTEDNPHGEIDIKIIGLRDGEKLFEELLIGDNPKPTNHPRIMKAHEEFIPLSILRPELEKLNSAITSCDENEVRKILKTLISQNKFNDDLALHT